MNFLSSSDSFSDWKVMLVAALGGLAVLVGLVLEKIAELKKEKYAPPFFNPLHWLSTLGWIILIIGIIVEITDAGWTAHNLNRLDPTKLPVLNINAFAMVRVKGSEFPDLTHWDSISLSTNWGSKTATATLCGNDPSQVLSSSIPTLFADDFGIGTGFPDSREYFLNFRMESVSAAMNLPSESASKSLGAANVFRIDANFLPPQSEILDGYAFVVVNNSLWKLFRIYPKKDARPSFENQAKTWSLLSVTNLSQVKWRWVETGDSNAIANSTIRINDPGKVTVLSNAEPVLAFPHGHLESTVEIIGTNVPSGKFDSTWWH